MDLALNHIELLVEHNPTLINYFRGHSRVKPKVVVSSVLPECTLPEDSVTAGELVTRVNGKEISSLHDLQAALDESIHKSEASKAPVSIESLRCPLPPSPHRSSSLSVGL